MTSRSVTAILQLMHTPRIGARTLDRVLSAARQENIEVEELLSSEADEWARLGLDRIPSDAIEGSQSLAEELQSALDEAGVRIFVKGGPDYPDRLTATDPVVPPVLFGYGRTDLLHTKGVAFGGSRNASEAGLRIATACSSQLAKAGINVVSGYANGVDLSSHRAALAAGGTTTFVLAEGILRFKPKADVSKLLDDTNHLVLSQFPPRMRWTVGNATQRNSVVLGLSDAVLVVESGTDGGTFAAGEEALKKGRPLFVVDFADPPPSAAGNAILIGRGGRRLRIGSGGQPDLTELLRTIDHSDERQPRIRTQRGLFDALEDAG